MARHKHPSHETKGRPRKIKTLTPAATPKKPFAPPPHTPRSRVTRKNTVEDPVERRILPSRAARNKVSAEDIEEIQVEAVKKLTIRIGKKPAATLTDESASEDSAISASEDSAISASEDSVISAAEVHDSSPTPVKRSKGAPRIQEEKPIACPEPICWKRFSSKAGLKSHLEKFDHTPEGIAFYKSERPFKCPITACPEIYKCFDSLYKHGVGAHSGMSDEAKLEAFGSTIAKKLAKFRAESAIAMPSDDDDSTLPQQHTVAGGSAESSPLSDVDTLPYDVSNLPSVSIPSANRESARKGKGPARNITAHHEVIPISTDDPDIEQEDVDEGIIDYNDHTQSEHELDEIDDVPQEVIDLEDDTDDEDAPVPEHLKKKQRKIEAANEYALSYSPWTVPGFGPTERHAVELMYCEVQLTPLQGTWEATEVYQAHKDKEMLRYIIDYPLGQWVIPKEHAQAAYQRLLERNRWRGLGIRVYSMQQMPQTAPSTFYNHRPPHMATPGPQPNRPMAVYGGSHDGGRTSSMPQQQQMQMQMQMNMAHRPPPGPAMPPPTQVLPSQQHAMPSNAHHYPHPQLMMGPPPLPSPQSQYRHGPYGQMQQLGGQNGTNPSGNYHQQHIGYVNVPSTYPGMIGMAPNAMPSTGLSGHSLGAGNKTKKSPAAQTLGPTPPYDVRDRPAERKTYSKAGKRKQAEPDEFPWNRQIDFVREKDVPAHLRWDIRDYNPHILDAMAVVRSHNAPIIHKIDKELAEKQKTTRVRKNGGTPTANHGVTASEESEGNEEDKGAQSKAKNENIGGETYHSGNFAFYRDVDRRKAMEFQFKFPEDLLDAAEQVTDPQSRTTLRAACKEVLICWKPGKKSPTDQLVQAAFRAYDTLITREQYGKTLILTRRAAECIVDFCPDLLWRDTLLRIVAEAGYGNTEIRNRFCFNGCYADKATVTKRIAAALGQKQVNPPRKGEAQADEDGEPGSGRKGATRYLLGEKEWNEANKQDFDDYSRFLGQRLGPSYVRKPKTGTKRRMSEGGEAETEDTVAGASRESSRKRAKTDESATGTGSGRLSEETEEAASPEDNDDDDDTDAVSVQSDGILDEIED
ncbi:hypothetical protein LTR29_000162 [Friedmanniomyces endolithicus]|nr:hypothetical protein LTR29_000162 [Friedmanniomyces endolithicus]